MDERGATQRATTLARAVVLDVTAREQPPSVYNHGYAVGREQAMRYFKARYIGPSN